MIKDLLSSFQEDFLHTDKGAVDGFIGVETKHEDRKMKLKQPQLIKRMIEPCAKYENPEATLVVKPYFKKIGWKRKK